MHSVSLMRFQHIDFLKKNFYWIHLGNYGHFFLETYTYWFVIIKFVISLYKQTTLWSNMNYNIYKILYKKKNEKSSDVVTLGKIFGTVLWKKIGKILNSVVIKFEHKKACSFIYKDVHKHIRYP